jgi:hypothetical protein
VTETFCASQPVQVLTRQRLATSRNRVWGGAGLSSAAKRTHYQQVKTGREKPNSMNMEFRICFGEEKKKKIRKSKF